MKMIEIESINIDADHYLLVEVVETKMSQNIGAQTNKISDLPKDAEAVGVIDDIKDSMQELKNSIKTVALSVQESLIENRPDELSVEVGFGFAGKGAIPFITSVESNASIKIKATWKKNE